MTEVTPEILAEAAAVAADFQKPGKFSLAGALQGRSFPSDTVTVYLNEEAGFHLVELLAKEKDIKDPEALEEFNKVVQQVVEEVQISQLTFELRGIPTSHVRQINKNFKKEIKEKELGLVEGTDEHENELFYRYAAPHIIRITDYAGDSEERLYTPDDIAELEGALPRSEWLKLMNAITRLSFVSGYFENATDAGFLQKS